MRVEDDGIRLRATALGGALPTHATVDMRPVLVVVYSENHPRSGEQLIMYAEFLGATWHFGDQ